MKHSTRSVILLLLLLILVPTASAQDTPANTTPLASGVEITWPPPVSEVWNAGDVIGTASLENLSFYYLEYIQLNDDLTIPENAPWIPATAAMTDPVVEGTLATLDTTTVPDGLYALRLVVVTEDQQSYTDLVMPIRVNNERFTAYTEWIVEQALINAGVAAEPTDEPTPEPPTPAQPMAFPGPGLLAVNVRFCDLIDNI
jgi:hypothetical protein